MKNLLTAGRQALIQRLSTITVDNGYLTNAGGNVRTGWLNEVLQERHVGFPLILIQKGKGKAPTAGPAAIRVPAGFTIVGAVESTLEDFEDAIEALEHDLLCCLMPSQSAFLDWLPRGISSLEVGAPDHYPPGEGMKAATVVIPIHLSIIIQDSRA